MLCLVFASHNGVSESEVLDLFPELEFPLLSSLLHHLNRLCIVTLHCGLIRFQHLQVSRVLGQNKMDKCIEESLIKQFSSCVDVLGLGGSEAGVLGWRE